MFKNNKLSKPDHRLILSLVTIIFLLPKSVFSDTLLAKADLGFSEKDFSKGEEIISLYQQASKTNVTSYEAHWKTARACRWYAHQAKIKKIENWEEKCAQYGRIGMNAAAKAVRINPQKVEGHLYFGLCAGSYADGANVLTALIKGLKDRIQTHLESAYEIDKDYEQGLPALALGRFWHRLPHALGGDDQKALTYYLEAERKIPKTSEYRVLLQVYLGDLLMDQGQSPEKAVHLLQRASKSNLDYYRQKALNLLKSYKTTSSNTSGAEQSRPGSP